MIAAKGKAAIRVIDCSADKPPAYSSSPAVSPRTTAQKSRCQTGDDGFPRLAMVSMTKAPESAEVTKKTAIRITASDEVNPETGR